MEQQITVYFFPVRAKYLAIGMTLWTYFTYGSLLGPILGLFALGGIFAAALYVRFGRSWANSGSYRMPSAIHAVRICGWIAALLVSHFGPLWTAHPPSAGFSISVDD